MKKLLPIIGIMVTMVVLIYLDSPYSLINKDYVGVTSIPNEVLQAEAQRKKRKQLHPIQIWLKVKVKTKNLYLTIH